MNIAILGRGLIGGSLEKAAIRAGHAVRIFPGRGAAPDLGGAELVFLAVPPDAVVPCAARLDAAGAIPPDARVIDIAGVKSAICREMAEAVRGRPWRFIGGHPMAGKEKTGYANSCETLFDGASMILVPVSGCEHRLAEEDLPVLEPLFRSLGFGRVVATDAATHDTMIAYTSQLCHLISSAYVREPLAARHGGFSAGSFRDMVRVGAPDPEIWTELFLSNREALLPVLGRFRERMDAFDRALRDGDREALLETLRTGVAAKDVIDAERRF